MHSRRVALTGGIATGKSHVRAQFGRLGVPTLDSDQLAREAVAPGSPGLKAVVDYFGKDVLDRSGALDRQKMGRRVFADEGARRALEAIVHPEVRRMTDEWFEGLNAARHVYAIADIPLLYEVGRDGDFDLVIVVTCEPEAQLRRLMKRDGLSEADALQRIATQLPTADKVVRADRVIRTDAGFEDTDRQVTALHEELSGNTTP
ncbi:MAG: dephospho-CoA kinase [Acidobacteria bacterium]|nr:dephospho-CoA kinase [Acidobacteriota bacterium]